jgi:Ca2+-binding EF-hand superfamily protein
MTGLQKKKFTHQFSVFDANKNGVLEWADFEEVLRNFSHALDSGPGKAGYDDLESHFKDRWAALAKLAGTTGKVTLKEWLSYHERNSDKTSLIETTAAGAFDLLDGNGDGRISAKEYEQLYKVYRLDEKQAASVFKTLDGDGDGYLSKQDVLDLLKQFFHSDDPGAPGNSFYGPLS